MPITPPVCEAVSEAPLLSWLVLWRLPGTLSSGTWQALTEMGSAHALLGASESDLRRCGAPDRLRASIRAYQHNPKTHEEQARADGQCLQDCGARLVHWLDEYYPESLKEISPPPIILCARGRLDWLHTPKLAMVGSRKATPSGKEIAFDLAQKLADAGLTIDSGLAHGIDAAAHRGALSANRGGTIAVLGTGIDIVYPAGHVHLRDEIASQGMILSEFPPGTAPLAGHFPRRNRIISGLAMGVLVVEAAGRSGSLITATQAREQNREVFAVPGSIYNTQSRGCHKLIRAGAKLVETSEDVLEELAGQFKPETEPSSNPPKATDKEVEPVVDGDLGVLLQAVGFEPTPADLAIARTRLDAATVAAGLSLLEIKGLIRSTSAGYVRTHRFSL